MLLPELYIEALRGVLFHSDIPDDFTDDLIKEYNSQEIVTNPTSLPGQHYKAMLLIAQTTYMCWSDKEKMTIDEWIEKRYYSFRYLLLKIEKAMGYPNLDTRDPEELMHYEKYPENPRYVVTACNKYGDLLIVGARHFSPAMRSQLDHIRKDPVESFEISGLAQQGFIDQFDNFMDRKEAFIVAMNARQINVRRPKSSNRHSKELFSEDIH